MVGSGTELVGTCERNTVESEVKVAPVGSDRETPAVCEKSAGPAAVRVMVKITVGSDPSTSIVARNRSVDSCCQSPKVPKLMKTSGIDVEFTVLLPELVLYPTLH